MSLERLKLPKEEKLEVLNGACQWFIEHKRNSGATEKSLERQRKQNRKMIENFYEGKETGLY